MLIELKCTSIVKVSHVINSSAATYKIYLKDAHLYLKVFTPKCAIMLSTKNIKK